MRDTKPKPNNGPPPWATDMHGFERRIAEPFEAFARIRPGDKIFVASACAEPQYLMRRLREYAPRLFDVEIFHLLGSGNVRFDDPDLAENVRLNAFFIGSETRSAVASGRADYTPVYLSEIPRLMRRGDMQIDVALIQVSPPDEQGFCNLGVSVETVKTATEVARTIIAQVNPRMPRIAGQGRIHLERIHALIPYEEDLLELHLPPSNDVTRKIAYHVVKLVDDGATLQLGIGKVPQAICDALHDKRDLGIHTEMFTDNLIDLIAKGAVNNRHKGIHEGITVASFVMGTRRLYDHLDGNPSFELYPADYVGDPSVIAQNRKMTAINSALEVDLTGQVCSDSIGHHFYSGFGSQVDFIRGAARSDGGKPIIAIPSTAKNGAVSRIVADLSPGSGVVLTRGDVHFVVTEYGIAYLHGRSIRERALALIEIAHPKFRDQLLQRAKQMHYLYEDQRLPSQTDYEYPEHWTITTKTKDGEVLTLRPVRPSDEALLRAMFYTLSSQDVYFRFMGYDRRFPHRRLQPLTVVDYLDRMAIVATVGDQSRERIIGIARFERNPATNLAECAFTVSPQYRRQSIGKALLYHLTYIARTKKIAGFRVEVMEENKAMLNLFHHSVAANDTRDGLHQQYDDGVYSLWYFFADSNNPTGEEKSSK